MKPTPRSWDFLPKEKRDVLIREISAYFETEHDQQIGVIAAEDILDFFLQALGKDIYNKAVGDAKMTIQQSLENLDVDLDTLLRK